jgi:hypothetical protein
MTADTQTGGQELARARTLRAVAIVLAIVFFGSLVVAFGLKLSAWYQVPAGLAAYAAIEWQRHLGKKIKTLSGGSN